MTFKCDPRGSEVVGWPGLGLGGTKIGTILEEVKGSCSILTFVKGPSSSDCFCPCRGLFPWTNTEAAGWIEGKKLSLCGPWKILPHVKFIQLV